MQDKNLSQKANESEKSTDSSRRSFMKKYGALAAITPAVLHSSVASSTVLQSGSSIVPGPRGPYREPGSGSGG